MKAIGMLVEPCRFQNESCWTFHGCFTGSVMKGFLYIAIGTGFNVRF